MVIGLLFRLAVLVCLALYAAVLPAGAQTSDATAPNCEKMPVPTANANPNVSIYPDPSTAWQPRGGSVEFKVDGKDQLNGINVVVCFGWPDPDAFAASAQQGQVSLVKIEQTSRTYRVIVPDLPPARMSWAYRAALWIVPLATMRIVVYGGDAKPPVVVTPFIGITQPIVALSLAALAVAIALGVFYLFARDRGVPGRGLILWMISTRNGVASLSQAQVVLWTFLIGAASIYVMVLSGVLIDITGSTLTLLGISGATIVASKLQNTQQDNKNANPDGKTAVPGGVESLMPIDAVTSENEVRLVWGQPTTGGPVDRYIVEYQPAPAAGAPANPVWSAVAGTVVLPHHTVTSLRPATDYMFRISATNAGGPGPSITIGPIRTLAQAAVAANAAGLCGGFRIGGAPTLTGMPLVWSPAANAPERYIVQYRRNDTIEAWADAAPTAAPQTAFLVSGLTSGVAYDFRVAAVNAAGQGLWSAVVSARTLRYPQWSDLVVTGDGRGEIDVTRAQMLFFTLIAALFVAMKVLSSYAIPEIPQGILLLMGISNGVYLTAKFIPD